MDFPTLSTGQDSRYHKIRYEDVVMSSDMEGGYVITRARHTRAPRRIFTTGFTDISNEDKAVLEQFYRIDTRGGTLAFNWVDPTTSETILVRFKPKSPISFDYAGIGSNMRWNAPEIVLEEV